MEGGKEEENKGLMPSPVRKRLIDEVLLYPLYFARSCHWNGYLPSSRELNFFPWNLLADRGSTELGL